MSHDGERSVAFVDEGLDEYGDTTQRAVSPWVVGAKVCSRVDCEFAWFAVDGFRECPACELRELRQ